MGKIEKRQYIAAAILAVVVLMAAFAAGTYKGTHPRYADPNTFVAPLDKLAVYGDEQDSYTLHSAYTPLNSAITEFHSYTNFPPNMYLEPYTGKKFETREEEHTWREQAAVVEDVNVNRRVSPLGTELAEGGDNRELRFSISSYTAPTEENPRYTLQLAVGTKTANDLEIVLDKFEINGVAMPMDPKTVTASSTRKAKYELIWTSEQLRQAGIGEILSFSVTGRFGDEKTGSYTDRYTTRIPLYEGMDVKTTVEPPKLETTTLIYPAFDSDLVSVDLYGFEVIPGYGYKAEAFVQTWDYSPNMNLHLAIATNLSQRDNGELAAGRSEFNGALAANSVYKGTIYAPCVDLADEKTDIAYIKITSQIAISSQRLDKLQANYDKIPEREQRVVDLCEFYSAEHPMCSVTEIINKSAERVTR